MELHCKYKKFDLDLPLITIIRHSYYSRPDESELQWLLMAIIVQFSKLLKKKCVEGIVLVVLGCFAGFKIKFLSRFKKERRAHDVTGRKNFLDT